MKAVTINVPPYGELELNVERVIAIVPIRRKIIFENYVWDLEPEDFGKVYVAWDELKRAKKQ